jgi:integrase
MPAKLTKRFVEAARPKERPYEERDTELKGLLLRVEPSGLKSFWLVYRPGGKKRRYRIGQYPNVTPEGARAIATIEAGNVAKGIDPQARKQAEAAKLDRERLATLGVFLTERYEPWALAHLKSGKMQLERIRSDFAGQLNQRMDAFSPFMLEGLRQRWRKEGTQPRTVERDVQRLQSVLSRAVEWGVLDRHPLKGLKPMKFDDTGRVRFLSTAEEAALRAALVTREGRLRAERIRMNTWLIARHRDPLPDREGELLDHLKPLVLVALNTGLRRGEFFNLKWADVNFEARMLTVVAASAKSGKRREIPLNAEALAVLSAWRERQGNHDGLVFPGADGARLTNVNKSWKGVVKIAGLVNFNFHDLRHSFASRLVQAGIDLNTVRELLGHSEIKTTLVYSHLSPDHLRAAVERVSA